MGRGREGEGKRGEEQRRRRVERQPSHQTGGSGNGKAPGKPKAPGLSTKYLAIDASLEIPRVILRVAFQVVGLREEETRETQE